MTGLFENELAVLRAAVVQCVPNPAATVSLALDALLAGQDCPAHAATAAAIAPGHPGAPMLGAALELMNISLHRLHEGLDRPSRESFCLSVAGDILVGDFLSSTAFRLLVQVDSFPIIRMVSEAIQKACENEILTLGEAGRGHVGELASVPMIVRRTSTLGAAAGETAAQLAGHGQSIGRLAGQFGHSVAMAAYWIAQARFETCTVKIATCRLLAIETLENAEKAASEWAHHTGNRHASMLCKRLRHGCTSVTHTLTSGD